MPKSGKKGKPVLTGKFPIRPLPQILLIGKGKAVEVVESALSKLDARIRTTPWRKSSLSLLNAHTVAVVLVTPYPGISTPRAVGHVSDSPGASGLPVFVLVPENVSTATVKSIYAAGATAVFEFPRETFLFPRCIVELTSAQQIHTKPTAMDKALAQTVRTHLKLFGNLAPGVRVRISDAKAFLWGEVASLWQTDQLRNMVEHIPGIESVFTRQLTVTPSRQNSAQIRRNVMKLIRSAADVDEKTVTIRVKKEGHVQIEGTAVDAGEWERLYRLIANTHGVRAIEMNVTVSPRQKKRDRTIIDLLNRVIELFYPNEQVSVAAFNGVAVLSGGVSTAAVRRKIEMLARDTKGVRRVVNKILVVNLN
jgi:osmotically-inducible protein OsmY